LNELVGEHFGRVPAYTLIDTETEQVKVVDNTSEHLGGKGYPAEILSAHGVEAMICSGIGRRAIAMFNDMGIRVYTGASGTVGETFERFRKGELEECDESGGCTQHAFGGHHHHH